MVDKTDDMNITRIIYVLVFLIVISICIYSIVQLSIQKTNCSRITAYKITNTPSNMGSAFDDKTLLEVYVKTAYNCCCSGDFRNDYVDNCALLRCNDWGVRALHFDIYSLNNRPVISTSTVKGNMYKELYNNLDMFETMDIVKTKFMNISDPLFLIFSVKSNLPSTYESMYAILLEIFGTGSSRGNMIYYTDDISGTPLKNYVNKVVICVEAFDKTVFYKSSLALITSLDLNGSTSKIYRESDILNFYTNKTTALDNNLTNSPQILFPNKQKSSSNYDFITTGIKYGITFTGMNFQKKDYLLDIYNTGFGNKSFLLKTSDTEGNYTTSNFSI
jgi:hypothetical protein